MADAIKTDSTLDASFCAALCTRLSIVPDLQLPSSLCRQQPELGPEAIQTFLQALLQRDPAVFLERYSSLLSSSDLNSFSTLRGNYEVDYWLHQAQQQRQQGAGSQQANQEQQQQQQQQCGAASGNGRVKAGSKTAANRRLAFMYQLEQQGEYFSDGSMRAREPLVWHEYIGQYEGQQPPVAGSQAGEGLGLAGSLLSAHDEVLVRARLLQQQQEQECQMSEQEESDDEAQPGAHASDSKGTAGSKENVLEKQLQEHRHQKEQRGAVHSVAVGGELMPNAAGAAGSSAAIPQQQQQQQQQEDMSAGAMRHRRQEFLEEMQSRFLLGLDGEHQDYAAIDSDAGLDEAWAAQQAQDAEDAYFDTD